MIPNSVTSIGSSAFERCTGLVEVIIGDGVRNYEVETDDPDFPEEESSYSVSGIGTWAFRNCTNLKRVTIGRNVESFGNDAFDGCSNIEEIICRAATPPTFYQNSTFGSYTGTLYVPSASLSAYQSSGSSWTKFATITDKVSITLNELDGTFYATYCTTADLDFSGLSGVKAYVAAGRGSDDKGDYVELEQVTSVPAGTGILLIGERGTCEVPFVLTDEPIEDNLLVGTLTPQELQTTTDDGHTNYVLGSKNGAVGFYKTQPGTIAAHKAYLQLPSGASGVRLVFGDGFTTAIDQPSLQPSSSGAPVYNLSGQRVAAPQRGIYVVGGKKVVIK